MCQNSRAHEIGRRSLFHDTRSILFSMPIRSFYYWTFATRDAKFHYHATGMPVFLLPAVVSGIWLDIAGRVPVVVNHVYNANNANAGKFDGSESLSVINAGINSHSGGAGAVPVMDFEGKVATLFATFPTLPAQCTFNNNSRKLADTDCLSFVHHLLCLQVISVCTVVAR